MNEIYKRATDIIIKHKLTKHQAWYILDMANTAYVKGVVVSEEWARNAAEKRFPLIEHVILGFRELLSEWVEKMRLMPVDVGGFKFKTGWKI